MIKLVRLFVALLLLFAGLLVCYQPALAQTTEEKPPEKPPEKIDLTTTYTTLEATSGSSFEFEVKLSYTGGKEARTFILSASGPKDWLLFITPSYPKDKRIKDVRLDPERAGTETVLLNAVPPYWLNPDPGEYNLTLEATAGEIKGSIKLKGVVTARYSLSLAPAQGSPYSTPVTAGKENVFSVDLKNDGSSPVDDISFSSDKPEGWAIEFSPDKVASISPGKTQNVDVKIKPSSKTIAGDYIVTLRATGKQTSASKIDVRVTVETPTIWGWTGVAIIVLVIVGLSAVILRLSRR